VKQRRPRLASIPLRSGPERSFPGKFDTNSLAAGFRRHAGGDSIMRQQGGGPLLIFERGGASFRLPFHAAYSATKFAMNAIGRLRESN